MSYQLHVGVALLGFRVTEGRQIANDDTVITALAWADPALREVMQAEVTATLPALAQGYGAMLGECVTAASILAEAQLIPSATGVLVNMALTVKGAGPGTEHALAAFVQDTAEAATDALTCIHVGADAPPSQKERFYVAMPLQHSIQVGQRES